MTDIVKEQGKQIDALVKALEEITNMIPATQEITVAHMMGQIAEEALAAHRKES